MLRCTVSKTSELNVVRGSVFDISHLTERDRNNRDMHFRRLSYVSGCSAHEENRPIRNTIRLT